MSETIPIAADHAGVEMKNRLISELKKMGYEPDDIGANDAEAPDDYPDYAHPLAREVSEGQARRGILLCGSGVGMDIVANRYPGVRAALAWEPEIGELSRRHNDSNVLVLPARFMTDEKAIQTMRAWLNAKFEGGRHERRVEKIEPKDS
ncbi:MAG TPA: RpiB/LacA/LacB family sugar-phosphate isomerase [Gemmatimonadaceae bacterium]|jgi:ribose 5-phosphate isomerase B|nr:RpiB/LacA/LacB family sugar-phosphate isomerase [Gemmatimonadaceae bacterium]